MRKLRTLSLWIKRAQNITLNTLKNTHSHKQTKQTQKGEEQTKLTTGCTLFDFNTEDTMRHNIVLMTSTSRFYNPYILGIIIKCFDMKT